ncbi:hypothetical protein [Sulfuriferula multivorans]|uniref:hypothetical protein n=1 Tax=Sulfuriferula multivorans TaxID=1559896 RepID=UPI0016764939|nr:hypothetical protein [Sulfuriferula multivorans]
MATNEDNKGKGNAPTDIKKRPERLIESRDTFMLCSTHNIRYPKGAACPACVSEIKKR